MKKMISMLAAALFVTAFAAGCPNKHTECADAKKKDDCTEAKFEKDAFKNKCGWLPSATKDDEGECKKVAEVNSALKTACEAAPAAGANAPGTDADCEARLGKQKGYTGVDEKCVHESGKCEWKKK